MQTWEYITLIARWDLVLIYNEQEVGKYSIMGNPEGPSLYHLLNDLGAKGWEVAGLASAHAATLDGCTTIILKRPRLQAEDE